MRKRASGVGLQLNPDMLFDLGLDQLADVKYDYAEVLCDVFAAPLDCGHLIEPTYHALFEKLKAETPIVAHGNFGAEFGFDPLEETQAVRRHIALTHAMESPWYADHMFIGDHASSYMWSQPLQMSRRELERVAGRAARMQDLLKLPLLHENAFYYAPFPGSDMREAEFVAGIIERAQTYSLLDLHNIYANSVNFEGYDPWQYLKTFPLDRVMEIHIAGGQWLEDWYHDLHNHTVPEPVWEMLEYVLQRSTSLRAVTLEVQGLAHTAQQRPLSIEFVDLIRNDLDRASVLWKKWRDEEGRIKQ